MTEKELLAICKDRFIYSEEEGGLVGSRTEFKFRLVKDKRVGNTHHSGYKYVKILGKLYAEHILVYLMFNGKLPTYELDHKDRDKLNNRVDNIRKSTRQFNCANRDTWNSLGFKGVGKNKRGLPFNAQIRYNNKQEWLGVFATLEDAAKAYDIAAKRYFGDNAKLNFKEN